MLPVGSPVLENHHVLGTRLQTPEAGRNRGSCGASRSRALPAWCALDHSETRVGAASLAAEIALRVARSLQNLMPYPEKEEPEKPKEEREFNPVSALASIIASVILLATAVVVIVPLISGLYKDVTGEYLIRIDDVASLY